MRISSCERGALPTPQRQPPSRPGGCCEGAGPWELEALRYRFPLSYREPVVWVSLGLQRLYLYAGRQLSGGYPVSSSRHGVGAREGTYKTPLGVHRIVEKIGAGSPRGTIFVGRRDTQRIAEVIADPQRCGGGGDLITTRILRLEGLEAGVNRGAGIDSLDRYIYIHGTPEEGRLGQPFSKGCIRMANPEIEALCERVPQSALVLITRA